MSLRIRITCISSFLRVGIIYLQKELCGFHCWMLLSFVIIQFKFLQILTIGISSQFQIKTYNANNQATFHMSCLFRRTSTSLCMYVPDITSNRRKHLEWFNCLEARWEEITCSGKVIFNGHEVILPFYANQTNPLQIPWIG